MDKIKAFSMSATGYVGPAGTVSHYNCFAGVIVSTATATATILVRNGVDGTIIAAIPAAAAAGFNIMPAQPVMCPAGVYFDLNGATGTVTVLVDD